MYVQDLIHLAFCAELLAGKMLKQSLGLLAARNFFTRSFLLCKKFTRIKFLRRTCWVPFGHTAHLPKSASMTWHVIASPRNEGVAIHRNKQRQLTGLLRRFTPRNDAFHSVIASTEGARQTIKTVILKR